MQIAENKDLRQLNTFGISAKARFYVEITQEEELISLLQNPEFKAMPKLILGGGSNVLLLKDFEGVVIKNNIEGIRTLHEDDNHIVLEAGAGVNWHQFVQYTLDHNYGGIENLSLIPGTVGAAPMQNIGAYGIEIKDVFEQLHAVALADGSLKKFDTEACDFGYRHSVFKTSLRGQYIITRVAFRLQKVHQLNISYGAIQETLLQHGIQEPGIKDVSEAVIKIRQSKLPDPAKIGNAGSFFKNPSISKADYEGLKQQYPNIPGYELPEALVKVPAGWLIEQCGWKGKRLGNVGVHPMQALVIVNHGGATGAEVKALSEQIQASVEEKFGIPLQPEVNFIG